MTGAHDDMRSGCEQRFRNLEGDISDMKKTQTKHWDAVNDHGQRVRLLEDHEEKMLKAQDRNGKLLVTILFGVLALVGTLAANVVVHLLK